MADSNSKPLEEIKRKFTSTIPHECDAPCQQDDSCCPACSEEHAITRGQRRTRKELESFDKVALEYRAG